MDEEYSLDEVAAEYASTLKDLVCNSKPLISTLTMLADDYQAHARTIVGVIERHIIEAPPENKLPGLYLIDSICKNIGGVYISTFSANIVSLFSGVFEKVDETTRSQMYKLRLTWIDIFSNVKLHMIDRRVHGIDPAWPVADASGIRTTAPAPPPQSGTRATTPAPVLQVPKPTRTVHVNPNVIKVQEPADAELAAFVAKPNLPQSRSASDFSSSDMEEIRMRTHLLQKKKELYELQAQKLALELGAIQTKFGEFTRAYLASNPGARLESDSRYQMEKINTKIKEESIRVQQIENAKQLDEVSAEILSLSSLPLNGSMKPQQVVLQAPPSVAPAPAATTVRTVVTKPIVAPSAAAAPTQLPVQPRVMTVTPMPKQEKEQKQTVAAPVATERGSRDPRKNRAPAAAVPPRAEPEVQQPPVPKPSVPSSPVKKSVVSDVSSKDPRKRMSGNRSKVDDIQTPAVKESSPKLPQPGLARVTPPRVKTEIPARAVREPSPGRSKVKSRVSSPKRESPSKSPPRKDKKRGGKKERHREESPVGKKIKVEVSDERRRKESTPGEDEKMSKGKAKMEPVEDFRQPIPSMEDHGDVDLRTSAVIPPVISLPKPISPVPEESEMTLFGTQDTDLRVLPSLVQKLAAAIRQKKENNVKEPVEPVIEEAEVPPPAPHITPIDRLAAALKRTKDIVPEEPEIPVPPPPTLPKKVEEKVEAPPPPKLPKIPKKVKPEPDDKEVKIIEEKVKPKVEEEKKKRKEEKGRRSPKRKRARSPALTRSPPRKRERERSPAPLQAGRSPLLEWDNRSRSPISRPHAVESPTRRRGWKDIKEKQEEKRVHEPDRRRERDRDHGFERGLIREREAERGIGREREPATERERRERELFGERVLGREPVSDRSLRDVVGDRGLRIERGPGPRPAAFRGLERQRGRRGMERGGRRFREDDDSADYILEEAEQQFKNGIITKRQFTDIVNDVMQRRESRLLREAQRRDGFLLPMHPEGPRGPHPRGPRPLPPRPLLEPHMGPRPLLDMRPQVPHGFGPRPLLETPKRLETTLELNVINIDDIPREVRFYGETAVALMAANEPRELSFCKEEVPRAVRVDGQIVGEIVVGDEYRELFFGNRPHMVKTGAPTRELFIDGNGFEYMFEAPDSPFTIDGRVHHIGISGPRPQVSFGKDLRTDLIAGRTEMILNGDKIIPIYLDALEQKFEVKGVIHTLRFENALQTVLFDGVPYRPNFGGLPVRIELAGEAHYARFLSLPEGVVPGQISIVGMKSEPIMPVPAIRERIPDRPLPPPSPGIRKLDRIASSMATVMANNRPAIGYSADSLVPPPAEPPGLNVHALFSRLLATGLLDQTEKVEPKLDEVKTAEEIVAKAETDAIDSVSLQIDSLRLRRLPIIDMLYKGVQCNSCGLRFPAEKTCQYSQHLDWHFRQNRREKAYGRKPQSRSWHYTIGDWSKFEEFGEERGWFEGGEASDTESISSSPEPELPTVPADSENPELNQCAVCREEIPQFFDEELEEWRLRDAVREDAKTFHSACYEDFKSHGEPGLFPGLDLPVEEEEEVPKEKPEAKTEEPTAVKEEAPEEPAIKEEPTAEPTEVKTDEVKIEAKTPPPEEPAEVETNPPTPVVDEVSVKEEERDIGTPVEDEKTIEVAPVIDIVETSERIVSSLDGNLELSEGAAAPVQVSKIRFNITAPSLKQKEPEKVEVESHTTWKHKEIEVSEPQTELDEMPPGEEPIVTLKPRMMGRKFKQMPVVAKGRDESGLCTIM